VISIGEMGESPFWRDAPPEGSDPAAPDDASARPEQAQRQSGETEKKGPSDPLFNPPGLKTRKTVMGLAPAPHLGGDNRGAVNEAEARKARVLARIAAMENQSSPGVAPPAPGSSAPQAIEPLPPPYTTPPPFGGDASKIEPPISSAGSIVEETYIGPPAFGTTTALMIGPPGQRRTVSSDGTIPQASVWGHDIKPGGIPDAEVMEPAPNTARMLQAAHPSNVSQRPPDAPQAQPAVPPVTALALRPYDPSHGREQFPHARHALSGPLDKRLVLLTDPHGTRAASFRVLRDNLLAKSMPRVVAVTSAAPNDGKTTCAMNLALSLTEQPGTRVLVVDANYFSPDLSNAFTVDRLGSLAPPDAASWMAPFKLVEIMPALHVAGVPSHAAQAAKRFEPQRFDALIERLVRVSYDFVIIDTPAMRGTPSVMQLLSTADGALLVVRSGGTTTRDLRRAAEQLPPKKALGIALMDVFI
jgi:Mrp family chromosome partitioning ATPase